MKERSYRIDDVHDRVARDVIRGDDGCVAADAINHDAVRQVHHERIALEREKLHAIRQVLGRV